MKMQALSLTRLVLGTVVGISVISLLLPQITWAQATRVNPLEDFENQENSNDPFSSGKEQDSLGVFDLIHRATLGNNRSLQDFSAEQNESLDAASARFRAEQIRKIQQQQQAAPANPVNMPQVAN